MKKLLFSFILILNFLFGFQAFAQNELFFFPFESENEAKLWSGGYFDSSNPFEKGCSIFVNNPFGQVIRESVTHVLDYGPSIELEGGKVYTLEGYVMNPLSSFSPSLRAHANLASGARTVIVTVSGIGDEWAKFSTTFYAGETGTYNLSIHFAEGASDYGFFADEISLREKTCTISSIQLSGQTEILIPATESTTFYYKPILKTSLGEDVHILDNSSVHMTSTQLGGVSFNSYDFSLSVDSSALSDTSITLNCALRNFPHLAPTSLSVVLTDNMIDNSSFEKEESLWFSDSDIREIKEEENTFISLPTNDYGDFGYFASLSYDKPLLLLEDVLYVMHARIKSDSKVPFSAIYAKNTSEVKNNTVYFNITDISGEEWLDVFAAFVPDVSGIYNVALNLCSTYDCTIFIDDITLSSELKKPEYITLHAPGNIAVPDVKTNYDVWALVRDQLGNILPDKAEIFLENGTDSVYFDSSSNTLTVLPDASPGKYYLYAHLSENSEIYARLPFTISYNYIGDGSFENTVPNEWWMVSSPFATDFFIRFNGSSKSALINCDGNYFMLLNNSYVHLLENSAYVFNSSFSASSDCTVTVFIETLQKEMLPLAQFFVNAGTTLSDNIPPALFLSEKDAVGRLFLYIESGEEGRFSVYTDNLSLKKATVMASNLHITGSTFINGAAEAKFSFINTVAQNADTSACIINWYLADSVNGPYTNIDTGGRSIYFDTSFLNKYVYFEVIPICPITGFSGSSVHHMPFLITYDKENSPSSPVIVPDIKYSSQPYFYDTYDHWAEKDINTLFHNNIVNGKAENLFYPDDKITRAEFAKMLSSAFSVKPYAYFSVFNDVSSSDWFYESVYALYLSGICEGTSSSTFSPHNYLTRQEATVMLMRIFDKVSSFKDVLIKTDFSDSEEISSWAKNAVTKAATLKIIQGDDKGFFNPLSVTTRAEASVLILRLINSVKGDLQ